MKLDNYSSGTIYKHRRIKFVIWYFVSAIFFETPYFPFYRFKSLILRLFGAKVGVGLCIKPSVKIKFPWNLSIGDHVSLGERVWIDNLDMVTIGNNCCISQGTYLCTGNHDFNKISFDLIVKPIDIGDEVWLGAFCILLPGTKCGDRLVLSAGSLAKGPLEGGYIYHGNPATAIKLRGI